MKRYLVTAIVHVDVEIEVTAIDQGVTHWNLNPARNREFLTISTR